MSIASTSKSVIQDTKAHSLSPNPLITIDLDVHSKKRTIEHVASLISTRCDFCINDILESLILRERLGSTAIGSGIAIPHGRLAHLDKAIATLVLLKEPVDFDAADKMPVRIVFGLIIPEDQSEQHLTLLRSIASIAQDPTALHILNSNKDAHVIFHWLKNRNPELASLML
ncbi:MAG: hypothetical protein COW84_04020 [Gammaproteobacteria bacterium CG22_combo_CG10-13_8_21_14_all_40_8]|nr:MAG: hypothetical protein COW84_04020 [Gammaproteobacteria bacterium CG22_combo_CG10-13_8_21_14_all_40_8]